MDELMSKRLRILYTIPNFDTAGSGKALLNIAKNLDRHKFEPEICCSHDRGTFYKTVLLSGIPIHINQTTHQMIPRIKGIIKSIELAKYFKSLRLDLIHSFHYGPDYSEPLAAFFSGIPWVYTKKNMNWGGDSKNGWYLRTFFSSHIIAQNKDMISNFFKKNENVSLVHRGVNLSEYIPKTRNPKLVKKYNIKKDDRVILSVANLVPVKGIEILLDAFIRLSKYDSSLKLFIVGAKDNNYGKKLESIAKKSKISKRIHFTGKVQNIIDYYSISDIFVLPTLDEGRREGCPVSLLEALSSNIKVIASDVSGIRDILYDYPENMFEAGNISELVQKIKNQLQDNNKFPKELVKLVKNNYSIELEVSQHEKIYNKVCRQQ